MEYETGPLMPGNYAALLTREELDDIVRYIAEAAGSAHSTAARKSKK